MIVQRVLAAVRSVPGRIAMTVLGVSAVGLVIHGIGYEIVGHAVRQAAIFLPVLATLELGILLCSLRGLRTLYGEAGRTLPTSQLIRAGLIGYAVNGLLPAGRAVAEATRASLLAGWVGAGRAAAAAGRMQAVALIVNCLVCLPAALAVWLAVGWTWLVLAILGNAVVTGAIGLGMLIAAKRYRIGAWMGRRVPKVSSFGADLDDHLAREPVLPWRAVGWELAGRLLQVVQNGILVAAVGGALGVIPALSSEGIHLVGASVGDLIPAQLGVMEGNFTIAAQALGLTAAAAVSIALIAHLTQLLWVLVGAIVPVAWRPQKPAIDLRGVEAGASGLGPRASRESSPASPTSPEARGPRPEASTRTH